MSNIELFSGKSQKSVECVSSFELLKLKENLLSGIISHGLTKPSYIQQVQKYLCSDHSCAKLIVLYLSEQSNLLYKETILSLKHVQVD